MAEQQSLLWGRFFQLGYNSFSERDDPDWFARVGYSHLSAKPYLRFDLNLWHDIVDRMVQAGLNTVVLSLAEGVRYESHPELAVEGSWSVDQLRGELARLRRLGLEPIPKLNFSAAHDLWLGPYSRCVSTDTYYQVCRDLIAEVIEIFDTPRFFHLGFDEETPEHQRAYEYVVVRQHDLWWRDLSFFVDQVEKAGVRAWVWSDYIWAHLQEFCQRMPKSVLQSNWYYGANFDLSVDQKSFQEAQHAHRPGPRPDVHTSTTPLQAYLELEKHGFDQIPTGSTHSTDGNFEGTVRFCQEHLSPERCLGFLQTVWRPVIEEFRDRHLASIDLAAQVKTAYESDVANT